MKTYLKSKTARVYSVSFVLIALVVIGGVFGFRATAASDETVSVRLKSQNSLALNFLQGRDLPTVYDGGDSHEPLGAGENRPTALASADFNQDGFPDLVAGYSSADGGGVITFRKANPEAFAPQSEESFAGIRDGRFPDPFLRNAESIKIPAAPDFLVAGDFDRDGNMDVITAARGGDKIYLLSGAGRDGGFAAPREIDLAGRVTALSAGEIDVSDNRADLMVGVDGDAGASLLVFEDADKGVFAAPLDYKLSSPATSVEAGKLDDDWLADAAILTRDGVYVLHGRNTRAGKESTKNAAARMEKINLPFVPQALALGEFIFDRAGKTELALLGEDGNVRIAKRGELDERPFSVEESRANRLRSAQKSQRGEAKENLKTWQPEISENWTLAEGGAVNVAASAVRQNGGAQVLLKANLSGQNTDDILFLDSATREVKILATQEPEKVNGEAISFAGERSVYTMEAANEPTAMLSMKLSIFVRPGLVILQNGKTEPSVVPSAPTANFDVDRTDDTNAAAAQVCSAAANDCSLRGAISKANAAGGAPSINLPAGTYTLTLANSGGTNEDSNATGDLDINTSLTIAGVGQATTIVQAGTTNANGIDKVFASNPFCTSVVSTSFSNITVRFGRNTQPNGAADFSFTGGGLDWCNPGANGTLSITNATFDSNSATTGPGGGIDLDTASSTSGTVSLTGVTISNNKSQSPTSGGVTVTGNGGGLAVLGGFKYDTTVTNSTITGNTAGVVNNTQATDSGGGVYFSQASSATSSLTISGTTISNNSAFGGGGGVYFNGSTGGATSFTINQSSVVSGNTSGGTGGTNSLAQGGGLFVAPFAGSGTITKTTIINNVLAASAATNRGGAGIAAGQGALTVSYNRIVGNTGTATLGTGLNKDINSGTTTATENWWGCSTGPIAAPCDTAVLTSGSSGALTTSPFIVLRHTASPSTIVVGQSSTLTASFLTDSANSAIPLANITVLIGLQITFNNPVKGTISGAQATIQASGTATATFTANAAGAGSADAIVDNDVAAAGRTNRAVITINQAATTTTLATSGSPSVFGQSVTFTATVAVTAPGAGTPTGTVAFKDNGVNISGCATQAVSVGGTATCTVSSLSVGSHPITAVYNGDTNFTGSTSGTVTQVVNKANTTATITNDTPDPSVVGQAYTVTVSLTVNSPGAGTPTGTITVSDGTDTCTITLPATSCNLTSTTPGAKTLTATYNGDGVNFNASPPSAGAPHTVNALPDMTITKTHSGNFQRGQSGVQYTITVTNSGGSPTSATVSVVDTLPAGLTATAISGAGWSCTLGTLTCTRSDALAASASYPAITLTVNVANNAAASVTNTATVSGGGETNNANDTANDPTTILAATAATVTISGRAATTNGRAIRGVIVQLTDANGVSRSATTTTLGYYRFADVAAGETYVISAKGKRFEFGQPTRVLNVDEDLSDVDFIADAN